VHVLGVDLDGRRVEVEALAERGEEMIGVARMMGPELRIVMLSGLRRGQELRGEE